MRKMLFLLIACMLFGLQKGLYAESVSVLRVPDGGIQPQAVVDAQGILHLIYFKGDAMGGDLFYTHRASGDSAFAPAVQVNSMPESVIAAGTIRGAHLALGRKGRVHVAWMGSPKINDGKHENLPMFYTRLNDSGNGFEPQRNVIAHAYGLDGGGSVAADASGHVYVAWHAGGQSEAERRVWVTRSEDDGATFAPEQAISDPSTGVCGCCGMRAFADSAGKVYVMYRAATERVHRDMYLLVSDNGGKTFESRKVHAWEIEGCPMSATSVAGGVAAWETKGQVYVARLGGSELLPVAASGTAKPRKHPSLAVSPSGMVLMAWTEGTGWKKGGGAAWQVFNAAGQPTDVAGQAEGVPAWSLVAAVAWPGDGFTVVY